jgi:hypothetical protein
MPETIGEQNSSIVPSGSGHSSSGFNTQGQLSWTGLVSSTFAVTVGILSRVSAAGVDPYTIVVGQKLSSIFQMTADCRRQVTDVLRVLPLYKGIGEVLSFGFGVDHLVRVMGKTEEGQALLVLCASLSECYHPDHAAEVLVELVRTSRAPETLQPSVSQWRSLLNVSAGIFSTTSFAVHAEKLMSLFPAHLSLGHSGSGSPSQERTQMRKRGCASPETLAEALLAIGQVTRGEIESITILGSSNAGWLAAFAEWHFQLSVQILNSGGSSVLYQSRQSGDEFQVTIVYSSDQQEESLEVAGRAYRIKDVTDAIKDGMWHRDSMAVTGRLPWNRALEATFGTDFLGLLEHGTAFGGAVGCLARIIKALRLKEDVVGAGSLFHWGYSDQVVDCYGSRLIANLVEWFPELTDLWPEMDRAVKQDASKAVADYVAYKTALKRACSCGFCRRGKAGEGYCYIVLLETIVKLGQLLSQVDNPTSLTPSRLGIEQFYIQPLGRKRSNDSAQEKRPNIESDPYTAHVMSALYSSTNWLYDALRLFSGRNIKKVDTQSAVCDFGICAYWSTFGRRSGGQLSGRVTVTVGSILSHERSYQMMTDDYMASELDIADASRLPANLKFHDISVIVRETATALKVRFELKDPARKDGRVYRIMPASVIRSFLWKTRFENCHPASAAHATTASEAVVKAHTRNLTRYEVGGIEVSILHATLVQQWFLLDCTETEYIIGEEECLDCSLDAALAAAYQPKRKSGLGQDWYKVWICRMAGD